jgi:hypothetical protein
MTRTRLQRGREVNRKFSLLWCTLAFISCSDGRTPPEREVASQPVAEVAPIRTFSDSYTLVRDGVGWKASIPLRFKNTARDTTYFVNCNGAHTIALQRLGANGWESFWHPITNGCLSPPIVLAADDSLSMTWVIWGAAPGGNAGPTFPDTTFAGQFRLLWTNVVLNYNPRPGRLGDSLPTAQRVSAPFTLKFDEH